MPRRSSRSRSMKRRARRTLTGVQVRLKRKRPGKARCQCGRILSSVPHRKVYGSKSSRKSNRPFGGSLCPVCARRKMLELARGEPRG